MSASSLYNDVSRCTSCQTRQTPSVLWVVLDGNDNRSGQNITKK